MAAVSQRSQKPCSPPKWAHILHVRKKKKTSTFLLWCWLRTQAVWQDFPECLAVGVRWLQRRKETRYRKCCWFSVCFRKKGPSHASAHVTSTHFCQGRKVKYAQSKLINLCNCWFGLQLVSKAWKLGVGGGFRQMPFQSSRSQWELLCRNEWRCLTEPNNALFFVFQ